MATSTSSSTTQTPTKAVAEELVELCRAGRNLDAIENLYHEKVVSIEPVGSDTMPAEMTGKDAVRQKTEWWGQNFEVHSAKVDGPFIGDGEFAVFYDYDTTFKPTGERQRMKEMARYEVKDGKIVREEFFYNAPPNA
jgi:ketosteroid isomerase-like protein